MSLTKSAPGLLWRFALVTRSFLAHEGLPFADALPEERIAQAFAEEGLPCGGDDGEEGEEHEREHEIRSRRDQNNGQAPHDERNAKGCRQLAPDERQRA